ncbi:hypothetical protein TNCV_4949391 [Trichonephila clavipes]|nr:hypothetical protein TNCV_4949391 [Trichonephila clavipes]
MRAIIRLNIDCNLNRGCLLSTNVPDPEVVGDTRLSESKLVPLREILLLHRSERLYLEKHLAKWYKCILWAASRLFPVEKEAKGTLKGRITLQGVESSLPPY